MVNQSSVRHAAVMVLHDLSTDSLILTQRSIKLRDHPNEICFPGGGWQEGDENFLFTALRELNEELAIEPTRVQCPRAMSSVYTLTGFIIHPWLATITSLIPCQPNPSEVTEVFSLPMHDVKNRANYKAFQVVQNGLTIKTLQYVANTHVVWGATAKIMMQLCE